MLKISVPQVHEGSIGDTTREPGTNAATVPQAVKGKEGRSC
jgi:hypothetical protein